MSFEFIGTKEDADKVIAYSETKGKEVDEHGRPKYLLGLPVVYDDKPIRLTGNRKQRKSAK